MQSLYSARKNDSAQIILRIHAMSIFKKMIISAVLLWAAFAFSQSYRTPIVEYHSVVQKINDHWKLYPETSTWGRDVDLPMFYAWSSQGFVNYDSQYWRYFENAREAYYEKILDIPSSMVGKRVFLRFEAVNYLCHIYVNGNYVRSHDGGYVPFEVDITSHVIVPSQNNIVRVEIEADQNRLFRGSDDYSQTNWPQGWYGAKFSLGIYEDVHLIGRPQVYVADAFVKTSYRNQKVDVNVAIVNASDINQIYDFSADILDGQVQVIDFGSQTITIPPLDTVYLNLESDWTNPHYWMPEKPYFYYFHSHLMKNGTDLFHRSDRFGFREFYIKDNYFELNGIRYNLMGDKLTIHSEKPFYAYYYPEYDSWCTIVDSLLGLNINNISFHQEPPRSWMLDVCDEKGMSVVNESALYGKHFVRSEYCYRNVENWTQDWVKRDRNHPSVIMWNVSNEARHYGLYPTMDLVEVGLKVEEADGTRPYVFAGDYCLYDYGMIHSPYYIFGYPTAWSNIKFDHLEKIKWWYDYGNRPEPDFSKPISLSEFEIYKYYHPSKPTIEKWNALQNIEIRHARIVGIPEIKAYRLDWAWHPSRAYFWIYDNWEPALNDIQKLKNSLNPLAVFDKWWYYDVIFPPVQTYDEGDEFNLTVVAFNDEFEGETVDVKWSSLVNGEERESGVTTETIPLGGFIERDITVKVPHVIENGTFELELSAYKDGIKRFAERYTYNVNNVGNSRPASVTGLSARVSGSSMILSWDPVTQDIYGNNMGAESYTLFYSPDFTFGANVDSITGISNTQYTHAIPLVIGNVGETMFYKVQAINYVGLRSDISEDVVGVCNYPLDVTAKTNINCMAFPFENSGLNSSQDILDLFPNATSVMTWNAILQGFDQYVPELPPTAFAVSDGQAYYLDVASSAVYAAAGSPLDLQFNLYHYPEAENTSWNDIIIPFDYGHIQDASDLYQSIQNCNGVAQWVAKNGTEVQYYQQYHAQSGLNNFEVKPGRVYKVHVSQNTGWPEAVFAKSGNQLISKSLSSKRRHTPHLVLGKFDVPLDPKVQGAAFLKSSPHAILTPDSPGFVMEGNDWAVQCASFGSGWQENDTLIVLFKNEENVILYKMACPLSLAPADFAESSGIELPAFAAKSFGLLPNYPNPFNGQTRILYNVTEMTNISLDIYNVKGQKIFNLAQGEKSPGVYSVNWYGKNTLGHDVGSGLYIVRLKARQKIDQQRILLIR